MKKLLGLIGKPLEHSLSQVYFEKKFTELGIENVEYRLFPLPDIDKLPAFIENNPQLAGFNVTIPYKEQIIPFLDELAETGKATGAVNTVVVKQVAGKNQLTGYNTDIKGFRESLPGKLHDELEYSALIFGTGGAAKAAKFVLQELQIPYKMVSRSNKKDSLSYNELTEEMVREHLLLINATPLGMYPEADTFPPIPYSGITGNHLLYDMVYNPTKTKFLQKGEEKGAETCNGLAMFYAQAEAAWEIWNSENGITMAG